MIGYYAHSHGSGHCTCANLFAKIFGKSITIFTDRNYCFDKGIQVVKLENEHPDGNEFDRNDFPEPRALHYAPVNMTKIIRRNLKVLNSILLNEVKLLIVDVSVEMAMLARISSIPYAYVRLQGDRSDLPHLNAYEGASFLIAYFPKEMESFDTPMWIVEKTIYLGFLSKYMFDVQPTARPAEYGLKPKPILLYLTGFGGNREPVFNKLKEHYSIFAIGPGRLSNSDLCTVQIGVVDETRPYIEHADSIFAACGANTTSEILSLRKNFVAVPEKRFYDEQHYMAENLERNGWAVDLSNHKDMASAISVLNQIKGNELPKISLDALVSFKSRLEFLDYRADGLIRKKRKTHNSLHKSPSSTHTLQTI